MNIFQTFSAYPMLTGLAIAFGIAIYVLSRKKWTPRTSNGLPAYTHDMVADAEAGKIDPVIGRDEEIDRVIHILLRKSKNNPILLGEPGVGKTAVVDGLALRIAKGEVPENLKGKRVLSVDMGGMISGTKYRGEFEERVKRLVDDVLAAKRHVILFIDEVHMIVQAKGSEGALNVSDILKPALAKGDLQTIGATTSQEYDLLIKPDDALNRRFQPVLVGEPQAGEALRIIRGIKSVYESYHHVTYTDEALVAAVSLSSTYIKERFLPDKAIDLIDEAGAAAGISEPGAARHPAAILHAAGGRKRKEIAQSSKKLPVVNTADIRKVVAEWTGKPVESIHLTKRRK